VQGLAKVLAGRKAAARAVSAGRHNVGLRDRLRRRGYTVATPRAEVRAGVLAEVRAEPWVGGADMQPGVRAEVWADVCAAIPPPRCFQCGLGVRLRRHRAQQ
jgi:hypothetical protein